MLSDTTTLERPVPKPKPPTKSKPPAQATSKPKAVQPEAVKPKAVKPTAAELRMEVIESTGDVTPEITDAWRELTNNPMGSPDWLLPWWEHYGTAKDRLQLIVFFDQEELVAVTPLYLENGVRFKLLGSGKVCSDHSELFIAGERWRRPVSALFLDWLTSSDAPNWCSLQLEAIDALEASSQLVTQWKDSVLVHEEAGDSVCSIPLPGSWDEYLSSLSKNHRKRVRRWTRQHLDTNQVEARCTGAGWDLDEAFECLVELHNLRRKNLPESGAFESSQFRDFHKEVLSRLGARGQAVICGIFVEDKPVAIEYELSNDDTVFAYQSGADMDGGLSSPGSISILVRLKLALGYGKKTYDLMRGNEGYKQHWGAQCVNTCNVTVWPNTLAGSLAKCKFLLKRKLRSLVNKVRR